MLNADNARYIRWHLGRFGCILFSFFSCAEVVPAAVLDQSQDATSSNILIGATDQRVAQTFTPGIEGDLSKVRLMIGYLPSTAGDASSLLLEVMATGSGGAPSGIVLGSVSLPHSAFPVAGGLFNPPFTDFDFGGVPLHAGTRYALALRVATPAKVCSSGSSSCTEPAYRAHYSFGGDPYPPGQLFMGAGTVPNFALSGDLSFQTLMTAAAVPEPGAWLMLMIALTGLVAKRKLLSAYYRCAQTTSYSP